MRELAWVVLLPGDAGVVVEDLESAEVPAPALVAVAHQALVTHRVQRRLACPHPQHRVGAALPGGPGHLQTRNIVDKMCDIVCEADLKVLMLDVSQLVSQFAKR